MEVLQAFTTSRSPSNFGQQPTTLGIHLASKLLDNTRLNPLCLTD